MGCTAFNLKLEAESGHGDSQSILTLFSGVSYGFVIQSEKFLGAAYVRIHHIRGDAHSEKAQFIPTMI